MKSSILVSQPLMAVGCATDTSMMNQAIIPRSERQAGLRTVRPLSEGTTAKEKNPSLIAPRVRQIELRVNFTAACGDFLEC